jgi:hypothetical protein
MSKIFCSFFNEGPVASEWITLQLGEKQSALLLAMAVSTAICAA